MKSTSCADNLKRSQTVNDVFTRFKNWQGSRRSSVGSVEVQGGMQRRRGGCDNGGENHSSSGKRDGVQGGGTPALYLPHAETLADREKDQGSTRYTK